MNWLIGQLFGSHAVAGLTDKIKAAVAAYLLANPSVNEAAVVEWASAQADTFIAQVLVHFPGWASSILTELLNSQIDKLIEAAYTAVAPTPTPTTTTTTTGVGVASVAAA